MNRLFLTCVLMLVSLAAFGAETVPDAAVRAETEGRWEEAVAIYRKSLKSNPEQIQLWLRVAEIHSHLKQFDKTAEALDQAVRIRPKDASLWKKLSEARAMANDRNAAFAAIDQAVKLAPDNLDYLRAHAELAVWANNTSAAADSYRKILALAPGDAKARLGQARLNSWSGQTDAAIKEYRSYLALQPDDKTVWLELIKVEGWNGDFPTALEDLEIYRARFGEDRGYLEQRARALAWLGKSKDSLEIAQRLIAETPKDPEILTTRLIALNQANRIDESLADLQTIRSIRPAGKETETLGRYLLTPLRSSVSLGANYGKDSDDLSNFRLTLDGEYVINPHTRLIAGIENQQLDARIGSGLENINGAKDADYRRGWLGVKHRFSPAVAGDVRVGGANVDGSHQTTEYMGGLDWRLSDDWWLRPEVERDIYAISPRAASLHVERESARLRARWTPGTRYTVDAFVSHDNFSDGNRRKEVTLAPRRAILRNQSFNLDLGLSATWFGFDKNLNNGYYDPHDYKRFAATSFVYWKLSENDGVSLAVSLGVQKDESMPSYKFGGDAVVQGFFGIYRDWYLRVYGSLLHNELATSGGFHANSTYRASNIGFVLTRRF